MAKTLRMAPIAKSLYRANEHKTLVAKWWVKTQAQTLTDLEQIVQADRLSMPDAAFRAKYAAHLVGQH